MTPVPGARVLALLALLPTFGLAQACPRATQASAFDTLVEEGWSCIQFRDWTRLISIGKRVAASSPNRTEGHFFLTYGYAEDGQLPKARESLSALNRTGALPHELVGLNGGPLRSDPLLAQVVGDAQSRADWLQKAMFQPIVPSAPGHGVRSSAEMRRSFDLDRDQLVREQDQYSLYARQHRWYTHLSRELAEVRKQIASSREPEYLLLEVHTLNAFRCWPGLKTSPLVESALGRELLEVAKDGVAAAPDRRIALHVLWGGIEGALRIDDAGGAVALAQRLIDSYPGFDAPESRAAAVVLQSHCLTDGGHPSCHGVATALNAVLANRGSRQPSNLADVEQWVFDNVEACQTKFEPVRRAITQLAPMLTGTASLAGRDTEGTPLRLSELRGRFVLVDFWASWCAPCIEDLDRVRELHRSGTLQVLGVNVDTAADGWDSARVGELCRKLDVDWPVLSQPHGMQDRWPRAFGVASIPTYVLIDPTGIPVHVHVGALSDAETTTLKERVGVRLPTIEQARKDRER